jgi:hypothetical protein
VHISALNTVSSIRVADARIGIAAAVHQRIADDGLAVAWRTISSGPSEQRKQYEPDARDGVGLLLGLVPASPVHAQRIKGLTNQGVRNNQLVGWPCGGLDGTGDQTTQTPFSAG